jgi:hypothetical protein
LDVVDSTVVILIIRRNHVLREVSVEAACRALETGIARHWTSYGSVKVEYSMIEVAVLKTVISRVAPRRLERASSVLATMVRSGFTPYLPVAYRDTDGKNRIAFGPLAERHQADLFLIDGVHRSLAALSNGIDVIYAAIIEAEVIPSPPGLMHKLPDVDIVDSDAERLPPFSGKSSAQFRPSLLFTSEAESALLGA